MADSTYVSKDDLKTRRTAEIEELIRLAEQTAERTRDLQNIALRSRVEMFIAVMLIYAVGGTGVLVAMKSETLWDQPVLQIIVIAATASVLVGAVTYLFLKSRLRIQARRDIEVETRIASELVEMIASLMKDQNFEPAPVQEALLRMRLRRLHYSPDWPS
jgi:hypothetical protein